MHTFTSSKAEPLSNTIFHPLHLFVRTPTQYHRTITQHTDRHNRLKNPQTKTNHIHKDR